MDPEYLVLEGGAMVHVDDWHFPLRTKYMKVPNRQFDISNVKGYNELIRMAIEKLKSEDLVLLANHTKLLRLTIHHEGNDHYAYSSLKDITPDLRKLIEGKPIIGVFVEQGELGTFIGYKA